jgi:hypothetical protein
MLRISFLSPVLQDGTLIIMVRWCVPSALRITHVLMRILAPFLVLSGLTLRTRLDGLAVNSVSPPMQALPVKKSNLPLLARMSLARLLTLGQFQVFVKLVLPDSCALSLTHYLRSAFAVSTLRLVHLTVHSVKLAINALLLSLLLKLSVP